MDTDAPTSAFIADDIYLFARTSSPLTLAIPLDGGQDFFKSCRRSDTGRRMIRSDQSAISTSSGLIYASEMHVNDTSGGIHASNGRDSYFTTKRSQREGAESLGWLEIGSIFSPSAN